MTLAIKLLDWAFLGTAPVPITCLQLSEIALRRFPGSQDNWKTRTRPPMPPVNSETGLQPDPQPLIIDIGDDQNEKEPRKDRHEVNCLHFLVQCQSCGS